MCIWLPFLGFRVYPTHRRLKRANVRDFVARFRAQTKQYANGETTLEKITASTQAWIAHAKHGNTYRLRAKLFREMQIEPRRPSNCNSLRTTFALSTRRSKKQRKE